jgi:hypothetical protein
MKHGQTTEEPCCMEVSSTSYIKIKKFTTTFDLNAQFIAVLQHQIKQEFSVLSISV